MKKDSTIYYYGSTERNRKLLRYWRNRKNMIYWYGMVVLNLIYSIATFNDGAKIFNIVVIVMLPIMVSLVVYLEYKTITLMCMGRDLLYDSEYMRNFLQYVQDNYDVSGIGNEDDPINLYVSRYLLLLIGHYEVAMLLQHRYNIKLVVDPYRTRYSYGHTRTDRYITLSDIM